MTQTSTGIILPIDVLSYYDDVFYDLVRDKCGTIVEEVLKLQKIRSMQSLLRINDIFDFLNYDSVDLDLNALKKKLALNFKMANFKLDLAFVWTLIYLYKLYMR
jgi:hypothetical protein